MLYALFCLFVFLIISYVVIDAIFDRKMEGIENEIYEYYSELKFTNEEKLERAKQFLDERSKRE